MEAFSVVTGASNGIGFEMAKKLAERSRNLVLVSRDERKLQSAATAIRQAHPGVVVQVLAVDLATPLAARRVFEFTQELGIEVDVLINNAGVGLYGEHVEIEVEALTRMLQLNVVSLCELSSLYGQRMKQLGRGRILNIASTAAYQPTPFFAAYGASKGLVLNFSEALSKELEDYGVTVSCLSPGPTDTAFFGEMDKRGLSNEHFEKRSRHSAAYVAQIGIDTLFSGRLSRVVGTKNYWRAWSARLAPRTVIASIAKGLMRTSASATKAAAPPQLSGR